MNILDFKAWKKAKTPTHRNALMAKMVKDNEPLIQKCAAAFLARTNYHTESLREDVYQAARIGMIRAIERWEPRRGAFSTVAYYWARHEMQLVLRDATPITRPKDADLPKSKQDFAASFYAINGREPTAEEMGLPASALRRAEKAMAGFVRIDSPVLEIEEEQDETPEDAIDTARDLKSLATFTKKLSPSDRKEFLTGKREDLNILAKEYVEQRRSMRCLNSG